MNGMKWSMSMVIALAGALLLMPGCMNRAVDSTVVAATEAPVLEETVDLESELLSEFKIEGLKTGERCPVCAFDLVQNETTVTIRKLEWKKGEKLRIGIQSEDGVESIIDTSRGELTNIIPDFAQLPSGKYTLFLENIGNDEISSVLLYYEIG